jgi:cell division protein FtsW (lipid II flippase)
MAQWKTLAYAPQLVIDLLTDNERIVDAGLVIKQACFYLLGLVLVLLILPELIRDKRVNKRKFIGYCLYFITFLALELPFYNQHSGFAGTDVHGHSFWYGSHFH